MEREYYHSIATVRFIAVSCFIFFVFGLFGSVGEVIQYCLSFAVPFLYMTFGFITLGYNEDQPGIIRRSFIRNLLVFGIGVIFFSIASLIYIKMYDIELVFSIKSIIKFLVFGKWQLPVGTLIWFPQQLCISLLIFLFFSKIGLLNKKWFVISLLIITLGISFVFGEFSRLVGLGSLPNFFLNNAIPFMLIGKIMKDSEEQIFDLGPLISVVTFVIGLLLTFGEIMMFNYFTRFNFTSNFIGSIVCAIGLMMIVIQFPDLGEMSGLSRWCGTSATFMFLLAQPVSLFVNELLASTDFSLYIIVPFVIYITLLFVSLIITGIIRLIAPPPPPDDMYYDDMFDEDDFSEQ